MKTLNKKLILLSLIFYCASTYIIESVATNSPVNLTSQKPQIEIARVNSACDQYEHYLMYSNHVFYASVGLAVIGSLYSVYNIYNWSIEPTDTSKTDEQKNAHQQVKDDQQVVQNKNKSENKSENKKQQNKQNLLSTEREQQSEVLHNPDEQTLSVENNNVDTSAKNQANVEQTWSSFIKPAFSLSTYTNAGSWLIKQSVYNTAVGIPAFVASHLSRTIGGSIFDKIANFGLRVHTINWFVQQRTELNQLMEHMLFTLFQIQQVMNDNFDEHELDRQTAFYQEDLRQTSKLFIGEVEKVLGYLTYIMHNLPNDDADIYNYKEYAKFTFNNIVRFANKIATDIYEQSAQDNVKQIRNIYSSVNLLARNIEQIKVIEAELDRTDFECSNAIALTRNQYTVDAYWKYLQNMKATIFYAS